MDKNMKSRQVLTNFHIAPFKFQSYTYRTIEHVFQAEKINLVSAEDAFKFTVESGHEIGLGDGEMAQKHGMLCELNSEQLAKWETIKDDLIKAAAQAKYEHLWPNTSRIRMRSRS